MATPLAPPEALRRPQSEEEREIENLLRQESAHGERLVSLVRALAFSLAAVVNTVSNSSPGDVPPIVRLLLPWLGGGLLVGCWGWYLFVRRSGYRPFYARISSVLDALVLSDFTLLAVLGAIEQGRGVPTALYAGAAPLAFMAFFALVSAGLRQDPLACVLTGAFSVVITGVSLRVLQLLLALGTRDAVAAVLPTRGLGEVPVKGKARPVPVFTIEGLPARAVSPPVH